MTTSRLVDAPLEVPFEDADSLNQNAAQERLVGIPAPDDSLEHPSAFLGAAMNDVDGQISNPTIFISGVF